MRPKTERSFEERVKHFCAVVVGIAFENTKGPLSGSLTAPHAIVDRDRIRRVPIGPLDTNARDHSTGTITGGTALTNPHGYFPAEAELAGTLLHTVSIAFVTCYFFRQCVQFLNGSEPAIRPPAPPTPSGQHPGYP